MRAEALDIFEEITVEDQDLGELTEMFPFARGIDRLYDRFGFRKTYHILDLVHNQDYRMSELLMRLKKEPLKNIIKEAYTPDIRLTDGQELFVLDSTRFIPMARNYEDGNLFPDKHSPEEEETDHLHEHLISYD